MGFKSELGNVLRDHKCSETAIIPRRCSDRLAKNMSLQNISAILYHNPVVPWVATGLVSLASLVDASTLINLEI